jgi:hypothetical protein
MPSGNYLQRTKWNVRGTDGTVVLALASEATGGSLKTIGFARKHRKPCLHIPRDGGRLIAPAVQLRGFVREHEIKRLNAAGSRKSKEPGIHQWVLGVLDDAFFGHEKRPGQHGEGEKGLIRPIRTYERFLKKLKNKLTERRVSKNLTATRRSTMNPVINTIPLPAYLERREKCVLPFGFYPIPLFSALRSGHRLFLRPSPT